jgi:hypothetical protein
LKKIFLTACAVVALTTAAHAFLTQPKSSRDFTLSCVSDYQDKRRLTLEIKPKDKLVFLHSWMGNFTFAITGMEINSDDEIWNVSFNNSLGHGRSLIKQNDGHWNYIGIGDQSWSDTCWPTTGVTAAQEQASPQQPAPQTATVPLIQPKIADRFGQPSSSLEEVAQVAQRVVLYDEDPSDAKGKQYVGTVVWRTEPVKASGGQPANIAVRADIEVPDRKFKMTMSFRRNTDSSLPASHTVEFTFILPSDFAGGGVSNVPGILMKSNEQAFASWLAGSAVKVTDGFFLVGLSNWEPDRSRNIQFLKEHSWFDVPLVYANQRRASIAFEKGPAGERAFADAFEKWSSGSPAGQPGTTPLPTRPPTSGDDERQPGTHNADFPIPVQTPQQPPTQQSAPQPAHSAHGAGNGILGVLPASSLPPASVAPQ